MFENRKFPILIFIYTIGAIYLLRLFYLQVIDKDYRTIEALNSVRKEISIPLRGQIYDRHGKLIVANEEVYDMYVIPQKVLPFDTVSFCHLFGIDKPYVDSMLNQARKYSKLRASLFLRQLSKQEYSGVIDAMIQYPGFHFEQSFYRTYPGNTMANALGYIGEIPKKQYEEQEIEYYRKGDYIGLAGLEKYYELELRGTRGSRMVLMNSKMEDKGSYHEGRYDTASVIGNNLYTYVDLGVQQLADSLFQGKVGAVVAIEPATGGIIAMGSYPTYDPALLSGREFPKNYAVLTRNPDRPLNNRPVSAFYRPGSTFKLVQAAIGLGDGVITTSTSLSGNSKFAMHSAGETANLFTAIMRSSNPYFDNVLRRILHNDPKTGRAIPVEEGMKLWDEQIMRFGFGRQLGVDLPYETKGLIPTPERYDKTYGKNQWKYSTIYSISIGEGEYGVNVLKLANMAAVFANRGYWITPHIVKSTGLDVAKGKATPTEIHKTGIDKRHFEEVVKGMEMVVQSGTGRAAQISGVEVCGKTGTSQNAKGKDHAIFIAFAPKHNPKIAIAVVVENGTFGGRASAPIAGMLMEKFLKGYHNREAYKESIMNTRYTTVAGGKSVREVE
ncbi:penicillin-binding transpeptidase domain-containing protein [Leadbetterella sp. DM7]|uniref:penicillin-binding transpeptidase domain-containing protein n=1 Tax=Leadbetterella sp. DM7 TaxID=3235085 RepID=UPI00349E7B10